MKLSYLALTVTFSTAISLQSRDPEHRVNAVYVQKSQTSDSDIESWPEWTKLKSLRPSREQLQSFITYLQEIAAQEAKTGSENDSDSSNSNTNEPMPDPSLGQTLQELSNARDNLAICKSDNTPLDLECYLTIRETIHSIVAQVYNLAFKGHADAWLVEEAERAISDLYDIDESASETCQTRPDENAICAHFNINSYLARSKELDVLTKELRDGVRERQDLGQGGLTELMDVATQYVAALDLVHEFRLIDTALWAHDPKVAEAKTHVNLSQGDLNFVEGFLNDPDSFMDESSDNGNEWN